MKTCLDIDLRYLIYDTGNLISTLNMNNCSYSRFLKDCHNFLFFYQRIMHIAQRNGFFLNQVLTENQIYFF